MFLFPPCFARIRPLCSVMGGMFLETSSDGVATFSNPLLMYSLFLISFALFSSLVLLQGLLSGVMVTVAVAGSGEQ